MSDLSKIFRMIEREPLQAARLINNPHVRFRLGLPPPIHGWGTKREREIAEVHLGKIPTAKIVFGKMHGDRRFKIDPKEKDPLSPRFDWSKVPKVHGGFHLIPISKLPPKALRAYLRDLLKDACK